MSQPISVQDTLSFHFMPLYRVMTLYFVKFSVKISIIIDYLRNSYYLCIFKLDKSAIAQTKHQHGSTNI